MKSARKISILAFRRLENVILLFIIVVLLSLITINMLTILKFIEHINGYFLGKTKIETLIGDVMLILLLIELMRITEVYIRRREFYIHYVFAAALIAVARKIIVLTETKDIYPSLIVAYGALVLSLGLTFYILQRYQRRRQFESLRVR